MFDFVERRQDRVRLLRLEQTLGDTRAQARHRHALFRTVVQPGRGRCRDLHFRQRRLRSGGLRRCGGRCSLRCAACGERVALRDAAVAARACDVARRQTLLGQQLRCGRRCGGRARCRCGSRLCGRCCCGLRCRRLHFRGARCGLRSTCLRFGVDRRDHLIGDHGVTVVLQHLCEHARGRCRHFEHDLVGLEFDQDFVLRDCFARLLLPLQHGGFRNRLRKLGDFDFYDSHVIFLDAYLGNDEVRATRSATRARDAPRGPNETGKRRAPSRFAYVDYFAIDVLFRRPNAPSMRAFCCS